MNDQDNLLVDAASADTPAEIGAVSEPPSRLPIFRSSLMLSLGFVVFAMVAVNVWAFSAPESFGSIVPDAIAPMNTNEGHNRGCSCSHKDAMGELSRVFADENAVCEMEIDS